MKIERLIRKAETVCMLFTGDRVGCGRAGEDMTVYTAVKPLCRMEAERLQQRGLPDVRVWQTVFQSAVQLI